MDIENIKCPNCGANLEIAEGVKLVTCPYCDSDVRLSDGDTHVEVENASRAGYEFEQGRIAAQREYEAAERKAAEERRLAAYREKKRRENRKWWVLGWILCPYVPATILVVRSKKLKWYWKAAIIAAIYLALFALVKFA